MKSATQTISIIAAIAGLIFGVTFVSQMVSSVGKKTDPVPKKETKVVTLEFPARTAEDLFSEMSPTAGHYDFWFRNPHETPVEVVLHRVTCKCTKVELLELTEAEEKEFRNGVRYAAAEMMGASAGTLDVLGTTAAVLERVRSFEAPSSRWQDFGEAGKNKVLVVAPARTGLLRVGRDSRDSRPQRLKPTLTMKAAGEARSQIDLEVPVQFVRTLKNNVAVMDLPEPLRRDQQAQVSFLCWSNTRTGFLLRARDSSDHPCFECAIQPISPDVCRALLPKDEKGQADGGLPIRCARLITVTVHERKGNRPLDLGPFTRLIELTSDDVPQFISTAGGLVSVRLNGTVQGELRLRTPEDKELVILGDFPVERGTSKTVLVEGEGIQQLELDPDQPPQPSYLKINLAEAGKSPTGKNQWQLIVSVPPDRADGKLPEGSSVMLRTTSKPPRRIRIPVVGHATVR